MTAAHRLTWAVSFCLRAQLRLTGPRKKILRFLSEHPLPVSLEMMARSKDLAGKCADTTVYRTLMLFREVDLVRQINLPGKTSFFVLNVPGEACELLVCRGCGAVSALPPSKPVRDLVRDVSSVRRYAAVQHELEVYGLCPECQKTKPNNVLQTKLPIRA